MNITVLTADFAQTDDRGKLSAIGLAWTAVGSPLPAHGVALVIEVGWHEANEPSTFLLELLDEDGHPVSFSEDGSPACRVEGRFELGRPPGIAKGTPLIQTFAVNLPAGMPLTPGHRYVYRCTVGEAEGSATFSVNQPAA